MGGKAEFSGHKVFMEIGRELVELRKQTGMNRREFAEYFGIPYRTVQDWELGNRQMPEYLYRLMAYKVVVEGLEKAGTDQCGGTVCQKRECGEDSV